MGIYTREQWAADAGFKARPGQEIEPEIYDDMFNVVPPKDIPRKELHRLTEAAGLGSMEGAFLMGEANTGDAEGHTLYLAFGRQGSRCFFLGLARAYILDGVYYVIDGVIRQRLIYWGTESNAIEAAKGYNRPLLKQRYMDDRLIESEQLFTPTP